MDAAAEFKNKFPDEKIKSVSAVRVRAGHEPIASAPAEEQGGLNINAVGIAQSIFVFGSSKESEKYSRISVPAKAQLVISKNFIAFLFNPMRYYAIMGALALAGVVVSIILLLTSLSLITFVAIALGFIVLLVAEAFLFFEMQRTAVTVFDRSAAQASYDPAAKVLKVSGIPMGSELGGEKKLFEAAVSENEDEPKL